MRRLAILFAVLVVAAACTPPDTTSSPSPSASSAAPTASQQPTGSRAPTVPDMTAALLSKPLPTADIFDLTRRMRGKDGTPAKEFEPIRTTPPVEGVGTTRSFWIYDWQALKSNSVRATLQIVTEHAKWWVQDNTGVDVNALRRNAEVFDAKIYPTSRQTYGSEWSPGVDGDPHINVMLARFPGSAAGYFSSTDALPLWVNQYSAEREILYINTLAARAGSSQLDSFVAHEFCHMIQYGHQKRSAVWFNEGQSQLCEQLNGFTPSHTQIFLQLPDTQLNDWSDLDGATRHYGAAQLFLEFLRQHAGGDGLINAFLEKGIDTPNDMDAVLKARGQKGLEELYANFVAANAFIGTTAVDAQMSYPAGLSVRNPATASQQDRVVTGGKLSSSVHNFAARYVELPRASLSVKFAGGQTTKLLPTDAHSGAAVWWSDRIDGIDSRLTRSVDLAKATSPILSFWTWFEIEKDYDYGYVAVSTDNGQHWSTLLAPATTRDDPNGVNLGNGLTGNSGGDKPAWVRQEVDLSAYAGKQILLRFEYITDGALSFNGLAIDDIEIPGVLSDDAESDGGWQVDGFVRSTNLVAQRYVVQLLRFTDQGATVDRRIVENGTLQLDVDTTNDRKAPLLAVTGFAVRTTQPVPFEISVDKR